MANTSFMFNRLSAFTDACTKRPDAIAAAILFAVCLSLGGCQSPPASTPVQTVSHVDLQRFMGDWYVIANIPTFIEREAYNATERYELNEDGTIQTTFSFNRGSLDGKEKQYTPKAFVVDEKSNAVWEMQFLWPFRADYRVLYVDDAYDVTIVGRNKRDYAWIMARNPQLHPDKLASLTAVLEEQGYELDDLRLVPHHAAPHGDN